MKEFHFLGKGTVYSYTIVSDVPKGFEDQAPYVVALIHLEEGPMITAQLTDLEKRRVLKIIDREEREVLEPVVEIGMSVEMVTRILKRDGDRGLIIYGYKFRPPLAK